MKFGILLFALVATVACNKTDDIISGSDVIVTQEIELSSFHSIDISLPFEVEIVYGVSSRATITANQNVVNLIDMDVRDQNLHVDFQKHRYENITIQMIIETPALRSITKNGIGTTSVDGFAELEELAIDFQGLDRITFSNSSVKKLNLTQAGLGSFQGFDLAADLCVVTKDATGDTELSCNDALTGTLKGLGDLYYKGDPIINLDRQGFGEVINAN